MNEKKLSNIKSRSADVASRLGFGMAAADVATALGSEWMWNMSRISTQTCKDIITEQAKINIICSTSSDSTNCRSVIGVR